MLKNHGRTRVDRDALTSGSAAHVSVVPSVTFSDIGGMARSADVADEPIEKMKQNLSPVVLGELRGFARSMRF